MKELTFSANESQTFEADEGAEYHIAVGGTFGGGTLTVNHALGGGTQVYSGNPSGSFSQNGYGTFPSLGGDITFTLAGATAPNLTVRIAKRKPR